MALNKSYTQLAKELTRFVAKACPGVRVEADHSRRWDRLCLTFRWDGFAGLLPEERFRLVAGQVPPAFYDEHCRGAVWLELTDGEAIDDYLALPRSEDIDSRLENVWAGLCALNFFAALEDELVRITFDQCPDDLSISKRVLAAKHAGPELAQDAVLAFMRHEAYSDWEVLRKVRPIVEKAESSSGKSVKTSAKTRKKPANGGSR